ncbi:MAG: hypothetical protein M1838_002191 [Thelocarpon superellum]|nr:MAG: hypothetical protein M1838_002191 [Thelocarpon superellum]
MNRPWDNPYEQPPGFSLITSLRYDHQLLRCPANDDLSGPSRSPSPFYMLQYHIDRLWEAAANFGWDSLCNRLAEPGMAANMTELLQLQICQFHQNAMRAASDAERELIPLKVRVRFDQTGLMTADYSIMSGVTKEHLFPHPRRASPVLRPVGEDKHTPLDSSDHLLSPWARARVQPWRVYLDPARTWPSPFTRFKTTEREMYSEARARLGIEKSDPAEVILINPWGELMEGSLMSVYFWRGGRWVTPPIASGGQMGTTRRWMVEHELCDEEIVRITSVVVGEECYLSNGVRGLIPGIICDA